jgi:hypothetical protein
MRYWYDSGCAKLIRCTSATPKHARNPYTLIDAICINQNDNSERAQQVRQIKDIYQAASRTLVWLGPGTDQMRKGFELIPYLLSAHFAFNKDQPVDIQPAPRTTLDASQFRRTAKPTRFVPCVSTTRRVVVFLQDVDYPRARCIWGWYAIPLRIW